MGIDSRKAFWVVILDAEYKSRNQNFILCKAETYGFVYFSKDCFSNEQP